MKLQILLIGLLVLSGCGRLVADCRSCDSDEYCIEIERGYGSITPACYKYGEGKKECEENPNCFIDGITEKEFDKILEDDKQ